MRSHTGYDLYFVFKANLIESNTLKVRKACHVTSPARCGGQASAGLIRARVRVCGFNTVFAIINIVASIS